MGSVAVVIVVVVVVLALAGVAAVVLARRRRQRALADEFGPEYERRVVETGDRGEAEKELRERKDRHDQHDLRALEPGERERFQADWQQVQRGFVDDPGGAVEHADGLVVTIMRARGYPVEDCRRRTDDLSVAQPHLVEDYRRSQQIVTDHRQGTATTEDLRAAFTSFRTLVEALLDTDTDTDPRDGHGAAPAGPDEATQRMATPPTGVPVQQAPAGGPPPPARPPSAPPATGAPDGQQERHG